MVVSITIWSQYDFAAHFIIVFMILTLQRQFPSVDDRFYYSEVTVPDDLSVNQVIDQSSYEF